MASIFCSGVVRWGELPYLPSSRYNSEADLIVFQGKGGSPNPDTEFYFEFSNMSCYSNKSSGLGNDSTVVVVSLSRAEAIDIAWNWLVGRRLQMILARATYRALADALLKNAERSHVRLPLFAALLFSTVNLSTLWPLLRLLFSSRMRRARVVIIWAVVSIVFLGVFQLLLMQQRPTSRLAS